MTSQQTITRQQTEAPKAAQPQHMPVAQSTNGAAVGLVVRMADTPTTATKVFPAQAIQEWPASTGLRIGR